ncbi:MAG: SEL1-like repeat protein [Candidatus Accumulibacter sp.]|nr:SEL1-like repeat protein [Candidatus Accumulibacter conexus]
MDLAGQLRTLQAAQGNPAMLALATVDLKYAELPAAARATLKASLEAAAIPHWCDETILSALLAISPQESAARLAQLRGLTVVEPFRARGSTAINVHEAARLALRKALASQQASLFRTLSSRAETHFTADDSVVGRIERLFHRLRLDPEQAGPEIRQLEYDLRHKVEDGLALAATFHEYVADTALPPLVQCWACWAVGVVEAPYLEIGKRLALACRALQCADAAASDYASATAALLVADVLFEQGKPGDHDKALGHCRRSLEVRERLLVANPESAQAARDVSVSLTQLAGFLASRGLPGDAEEALGHYRRSLEVRERLLVANPESAQAARDVSVSLSKLADFLASRGLPGDAEVALRHYRRSLEVGERLLVANPESAQAARDMSVRLIQLGGLLASRGLPGDAEAALGHYRRSLEVGERLLVASPESAQAARDVSVSLTNLADFLASRGLPGDAEEALGHYRRSLEFCERLLVANPESAQAARDVSVSLNKLADFLASRGLPGDAEAALGHYRRSLEVGERLLVANPESALAARDVLVSLIQLGGFLASRGLPGDAEAALGHYRRSLELGERLLVANPESAQAARDVSVSLIRLGGFLASRGLPGDAEAALGHYRRSLELGEPLLVANPESAQAARDVSVSLERLADFLASRGLPGDAEESVGHYRRSLKLCERLLVANPQSAQAARDASVRLTKLADFLARRGLPGDAEEAFGHYRRSLELRERLLVANPESALAARDVSGSLERLGRFLASRGLPGDAEEALGHYRRSLEVGERLLVANPESAQAARDVLVSFIQLGDFLASRGLPGDAEEALGHYRRSLEVGERLLLANPESAQAARDVSVSLIQLGGFLASRGLPGDAEEALGHYRRSLEAGERLLVANPESAQAARDVSASLNKLAEFLASRGLPGDAEAALGHYRRSLEVGERLLVANPESAQAARDVVVSLIQFGGFLASRGLPGDAEAAFGHYRRSLGVGERLLAANPESAQAARDVSVSLNKLAAFLASRGLPGDAEAALGHCRRSLEVGERLLVANPESAQAARDVSVSLSKLADFLASRGLPGDAEESLGHYRRSLEFCERLLVANPESAQAARDVSVGLQRLAVCEGGWAGREAKALELQTRALGLALKLRERNPQSVFHGRAAAVSFLLTSQRAQAAGQEDLAAKYLAGCYGVLDELISAGCQLDPPMMRLHAQLKPMFSRP